MKFGGRIVYRYIQCTLLFRYMWTKTMFFAVNLYNIYLFIQVSVNGVDLYEYKHRLRNLKSIGWLIIQGDVVLSTVMVQ